VNAVPAGLGSLFTGSTRRKFVLALVGSMLAALADAAGVLAILPLMQVLTGTGDDSAVVRWVARHTGEPTTAGLVGYLAALVFGAFLLKGLLTIGFRWWMLGFVYRQESDTSVRLLRHYLAAPYPVHLRRNSAELIRTMNDAVSQTYSAFVVGLVSGVTEAMTIVAVMAALIFLMPLPALGVAVYFAVTALIFQRLVRRRATTAGERMVGAFVGVYTTAMHALGGIKEIKVRNNAEHFVGDYRRARLNIAAARRMSVFLGELPKYVFEILFIIGIGLLTLGVFASQPSAQALGTIALFVAGGFRVLPSLVRLMSAVNSMRVGRRALRLVLEDLREVPSQPVELPAAPAGEPAPLERVLRLEDVWFRHQGSQLDVLQGVDIEIGAGSSVALVGESGAGKSTIVDLLLGLQRPVRGRVTVDGWDVGENLPRWQATLGMVPQDVYLLDASLRANITFGAPLPDDEERVREAVTKAQLDELVLGLPQGLETFVGERGTRLSGGQRQRIGIARALYLRPRVLILDEATSALDNETERRITETIAGLQGQMTIVLVAHRLSTVRHCDQLVFLKDGKVLASGSFEEVRDVSLDFARMVALGATAG
jgi:ABC-type multidrug transport system fused ATPase/permease subunit